MTRLGGCWKFAMRQLFVVRQVVGMHSNVIRFGVFDETNCLDLCAIFQKSLAHAMHSVHDAAVARESDRESEIAIQHQARMIDDFTAGQRSGAFVAPVGLVQFTNG